MWVLLLLVQVKHKRTLYRFLLQKQKYAGINGDRNSNTTNKTTEMAGKNAIYTEKFKRITEVSRSYNHYSGKCTNTD